MIFPDWKSLCLVEKSHDKEQATFDSAPGEEGKADPVLQKVWGFIVERQHLLRTKQMKTTQACELTIMTYESSTDWSMHKELHKYSSSQL